MDGWAIFDSKIRIDDFNCIHSHSRKRSRQAFDYFPFGHKLKGVQQYRLLK